MYVVVDIRNNICSFVSYQDIISTGECRYPPTTSASRAKINLSVLSCGAFYCGIYTAVIPVENLLVYRRSC